MAPGLDVRNQTTDWQRKAEAVVGVGETASTSAPAKFRGIHSGQPVAKSGFLGFMFFSNAGVEMA